MGFSVEQDADVQAYHQLRAEILAREARWRNVARGARRDELRRLGFGEGGGGVGILRGLRVLCEREFRWRSAALVEGVVVVGKQLEGEGTSDFEGGVEDVEVQGRVEALRELSGKLCGR